MEKQLSASDVVSKFTEEILTTAAVFNGNENARQYTAGGN